MESGSLSMFKVGSKSFSSEREVLDHLQSLSGKGPSDSKAIFYSNPNYTQAFYGENQGEAFEGAGYVSGAHTISQTQAGKFIDELRRSNQTTAAFDRRLFSAASQVFARDTSGPVDCFTFEAPSRDILNLGSTGSDAKPSTAFGLTASQAQQNPSQFASKVSGWPPHSDWFKVELPALLNNPNVSTLNGLPREKLNNYWQQNNYSTNSLLRISKDVGDSIFRSHNFVNQPPPLSGISQSGNTMQPIHNFNIEPMYKPLYECTTSTSSQTSELFKAYETLPGGVTFSEDLSSNIKVESVEIDPDNEGNIIINSNVVFKTSLSFEEISLLIESYHYRHPLGATSTRYTRGTQAENIVGTTLRLADKILGDFIFHGVPIEDEVQHEDDRSDKKVIGALLELEPTMLASELRQVLGRMNADVIVDYNSVKFSVKDNALHLDSVNVLNHAALFTGSDIQPKLIGGAEDLSKAFPFIGDRIEQLGDGSLLAKNKVFRKVSEYAAFISLINSLAEQSSETRLSVAGKLETDLVRKVPEAVAETTIIDDAQLIAQASYNINELRDAFFESLDKIKTEKDPDTFAQLVASAFIFAQKSGIEYLTKSLAFEVCERLPELVPTATDNPDLKLCQMLCAVLAAENVFSSSGEDLEPNKESPAQSASYGSLQAALDHEENLRFKEAIDNFVEAAKKTAALTEVGTSGFFEKKGHVLDFGKRFNQRGYTLELAAKLGSSLLEACRESSELSALIEWPYLSVLGSCVKKLTEDNIPYDYLIDEVRDLVGHTDKATKVLQLLAGIASQFNENDELAKEIQLKCFVDLGQTSKEYTASVRLIQRASRLASLSEEQQIQELKCLKPSWWQSSGQIGVDRLKIESEIHEVSADLYGKYEKLVKEISDEVAKKKDRGIVVMVSTISSLLYGKEHNYKLGSVTLLSDAISRKVLDCDTSAFIFVDVLKTLGINSELIETPGHAFLKVGPLYVETAQGEVLSEKSVRKKYGSDIRVGDSVLFGASISYASTAHAVELENDSFAIGKADLDKGKLLRKAYEFTPNDTFIIYGLALELSRLSFRKASSRLVNQDFDTPKQDKEETVKFEAMLKIIDDALDSFGPNTRLIEARLMIQAKLEVGFDRLEPIYMELAPSIVNSQGYYESRGTDEDQRLLEARVLTNLSQMNVGLRDSFTGAAKAKDLEEMKSLHAKPIDLVQTITDIERDIDLRAEWARYGLGSGAFRSVDLAAQSAEQAGLELNKVLLYSITLWEQSHFDLALLRRAAEREKVGDIERRSVDINAFLKRRPDNAEALYIAAVNYLLQDDFDKTLEYLDKSAEAYSTEPQNLQILRQQTKAMQAAGKKMTMTLMLLKQSLLSGDLEKAKGLLKLIDGRVDTETKDAFEEEYEFKRLLRDRSLLAYSGNFKDAHEAKRLVNEIAKLARSDSSKAGKSAIAVYESSEISMETKSLVYPELVKIAFTHGLEADLTIIGQWLAKKMEDPEAKFICASDFALYSIFYGTEEMHHQFIEVGIFVLEAILSTNICDEQKTRIKVEHDALKTLFDWKSASESIRNSRTEKIKVARKLLAIAPDWYGTKEFIKRAFT